MSLGSGNETVSRAQPLEPDVGRFICESELPIDKDVAAVLCQLCIFPVALSPLAMLSFLWPIQSYCV